MPVTPLVVLAACIAQEVTGKIPLVVDLVITKLLVDPEQTKRGR